MKPLRPYLYHAYYNWIIDNDNTPYLLVNAEYPHVDVPQEFVREGKIILNVAPRSIGQYVVNDEFISFNARFQGMLRDIHLPFGAIDAIYAQESGDGVMFQEDDYYAPENYLEKQRQAAVKKTAVKRKSSHLKLVK